MITIDRIKELLPHRYPMLLVDRVTDVVPGERLTALKAVTANEPWYQELPPNAAEAAHDYPAVLLLESWCQAAGLLGGAGGQAAGDDRVLLLGAVADVRFTGRVRPGDVVEHEVRLVRDFGENLILAGRSTVDGRTVAEIGRASMAVRPAHSLETTEPTRR
ncbi:3-hydroxyacyl-ACP dehydratase FabZ family protein [Kitasatospora sp. NPDC048239]|uniref:3-hydroxyacyl-ACP dehydratase FabZ family protein n=1 Tax=Kitasatospora sp. NPDC048239 TaxID=3364046 RepID=UPI00371DA9EF